MGLSPGFCCASVAANAECFTPPGRAGAVDSFAKEPGTIASLPREGNMRSRNRSTGSSTTLAIASPDHERTDHVDRCPPLPGDAGLFQMWSCPVEDRHVPQIDRIGVRAQRSEARPVAPIPGNLAHQGADEKRRGAQIVLRESERVDIEAGRRANERECRKQSHTQ